LKTEYWTVVAHQFHHLLARCDQPGNGAKKGEAGDAGRKPVEFAKKSFLAN